ncbi:hypothetical protein K2173_009732 [Erythroxylum novogranatense]|uniref:Pectinesterase inhibitor domain-containing protein n=1 Tax=Erythroxylum novogranatense TaxID=1862640 RepID=A0AAV8SYU2_9ROSI|nr:hypothetical protein K2173_009732 [Erythroxylum novogranatense]
MAISSTSCHVSQILFLSVLFTVSIATAEPGNKLVEEICNRTSDYSFCVNALYSDSRTPEADLYILAFISVGLADISGTVTRDYINTLLKNSSSHGDEYYQRLLTCSDDYNKAVLAIETAYSDLNFESFYGFPYLAGKASAAVEDCEAGFHGILSPPLGDRNHDLKVLCEIFSVVGKLLTGESLCMV